MVPMKRNTLLPVWRMSVCMSAMILLPATTRAQAGVCASIACSGHGQCVETENGPACACAKGYVPDHTELNCVPNENETAEAEVPSDATPVTPPVAPPVAAPSEPISPTEASTAVIVESAQNPPPSAATSPESDTSTVEDGDSSAPAAKTTPVDNRTQRKAQGGLIAGVVFDILGYALFISGGAVVGQNLGVGLMLSEVGGLSMTIGAVIGTTSMTIRHRGFLEAGFNPNTKRKTGAWVLTSLTIAFFGAGIGLGVAADNLGMGIASICMNATAVILETMNFLVTRKKWNDALMASTTSSQLDRIMFAPYFATVPGAPNAKQMPVFGVAGLF